MSLHPAELGNERHRHVKRPECSRQEGNSHESNTRERGRQRDKHTGRTNSEDNSRMPQKPSASPDSRSARSVSAPIKRGTKEEHGRRGSRNRHVAFEDGGNSEKQVGRQPRKGKEAQHEHQHGGAETLVPAKTPKEETPQRRRRRHRAFFQA
ncbi:hypothetical protein M434DRAFT_395999 [Hypoxylon sp. CO27-5]|nr:hypothetical protein M434DRAFT_395999 [Hypoxylon sp. CO27-5]